MTGVERRAVAVRYIARSAMMPMALVTVMRADTSVSARPGCMSRGSSCARTAPPSGRDNRRWPFGSRYTISRSARVAVGIFQQVERVERAVRGAFREEPGRGGRADRALAVAAEAGGGGPDHGALDHHFAIGFDDRRIIADRQPGELRRPHREVLPGRHVHHARDRQPVVAQEAQHRRRGLRARVRDTDGRLEERVR